MWCYTRILAHYPYVVLVAVLIVSITCLVVTVTIGDRPSFEEPMVGFEPRGTVVSNRLTAYQNLLDDASLDQVPHDTIAVVQQRDNQLRFIDTPGTRENGSQSAYHRYNQRQKRRKAHFFCDVPDQGYGKLVYQALDNGNLFTLKNIHTMCRMEERIVRSNPVFLEQCPKQAAGQCCRSVSLGNYIALVTNRDSCLDVNETDVAYVLGLVSRCSEYYHNFTLTGSCDARHSRYGEKGSHCTGVPKKCRHHNAIFNIIHYIADMSFQRPVNSLQYAVSFLPLQITAAAQSQAVDSFVQLYLDMERGVEHMEQAGGVRLAAVDLGIKYNLFHYYLANDSKFLVASAITIFFLVWVFTGSIFITCMTFLTMFWSLELAYFLYVFVFEIKFFPYMNLVTVLLVIAIGADDVFVYTKVWHLAKKERNNGTLEKIVSDTLRHATLSMLVTSLTTACALFANVVSPITSIQCFSIYAGTTMICNLILMITWTPASIVVQEKWCNCCFFNSPKIYRRYRKHYRNFFECKLPHFVIQLRYVWIFVLGGLGVFGGVIVFHYPKLKLPTSFRFQMFRKSHLLEVYDQEIRDYFWFEKAVQDQVPMMPVRVVWGVQETDNGNWLNPYERGHLQLDPVFDPTSHSAQKWLLAFCQNLRTSSFYQKVNAVEYTNCFIEQFKEYMELPCRDNFPCCNKSFPYSKTVFHQCIKEYIPALIKTPFVNWDITSPGLRFTGNQISALVVEFSSDLVYTFDFEKVGQFYNRVNQWVTEQLLSAPLEMQSAWFISDLKFFNIQKSLAEGMPLAFGISILVAAVVTFFTSLNLLITLFAVVSIACIMSVTIGCLVLLGWELNILESVVITVAVGLSIDHTLHYGMAYRLAPDLDRHNRSLCSMKRVGDVIFMAAMTTFLAGLIMVPSVTLVYQKFGIFLMLVISISWVYSTLFLQSLLSVLGPQGGFGQFHWPSLDCCSIAPRSRIDRTVYTMSESTMSSSSSGYPCHASTDTQEHDLLSERSDSGGTPYLRPQRTGRHYARPRSESVSPDGQSRRKLLSETVDDSVEVQATEKVTQKLCTEV